MLIRARYPFIYLVSWEEERVEQILQEIAQRRNKKVFMCGVSRQGIRSAGCRTLNVAKRGFKQYDRSAGLARRRGQPG